MPWKRLADRMNSDAKRIRNERAALSDEVKQLQADIQQQTDSLARANVTIDVCREQLERLQQSVQPASPTSQIPATPSGSQLPMHQEMGGHVRLSTALYPSPMLMTVPDRLSMPPTLKPMRDVTSGPRNSGTLMLPRLMPQPSATLKVPPLPDQEEAIDSEPQGGPESQQ